MFQVDSPSASELPSPSLTRSLLESLAREDGLLRVLTGGIPDLMYVKDERCRYVFNNPAHLRFLGASHQSDIAGKSVLDLFPGDLAEKFYRDEQAIIDSGVAIINQEEQTCDHAGRRMWVSTTKVPLRDSEGRVIGLAGISRDITERKHAEEQLVRANSELAKTQLELAEVAKMQLLGALAAGIVHDVKNPLSVISVGIDLLERLLKAPEPAVQAVLRNIRAGVENANGVLKGLLEFCRPQELNHHSLNLREAIDRALLLLKFEISRRHVETRTVIPEGLPPVRADLLRIEQVLLNLVLNALHAMPEGGVLTLHARRDCWDGKPRGYLAPGDPVVQLMIDDSGPGISSEHLSRVFDPFFTTKPPGEGTGLGLPVAKRIMDLHGGAIQLMNRPEGGARATLTFKVEGVDHEPQANPCH